MEFITISALPAGLALSSLVGQFRSAMNGLLSDSYSSWPWISNIAPLTAYSILYYDYFLTLSKEVNSFWRAGSHSWASILFLVNRYMALLGHVPILFLVFWDPYQMKSL